jgi:small subunit ribosomal protein S8
MTIMDPVADLLTRIRNGSRARHRYVEVGHSRLKAEIVALLEKHGYIEGHLVQQDGPRGKIRIYLRYRGRRSVIQGLQRVSKPSCRIYRGRDRIPTVFGGMGIAVVSTSQGILDGKAAADKGIGGEVLCSVW